MSNVTCEKLQQMERHRATMKHISARGAIEDQNKKVTLMQQLLPVVSKDFMAELVKTFLAADIPLHKLRNLHAIQLFKNLGEKINAFRNCVQRLCQDSSKQRTRLFEVPTESVYSLSSMRVKWIRRNLSMLLWETLMCQRKRISSSAALRRP